MFTFKLGQLVHHAEHGDGQIIRQGNLGGENFTLDVAFGHKVVSFADRTGAFYDLEVVQ